MQISFREFGLLAEDVDVEPGDNGGKHFTAAILFDEPRNMIRFCCIKSVCLNTVFPCQINWPFRMAPLRNYQKFSFAKDGFRPYNRIQCPESRIIQRYHVRRNSKFNQCVFHICRFVIILAAVIPSIVAEWFKDSASATCCWSDLQIMGKIRRACGMRTLCKCV